MLNKTKKVAFLTTGLAGALVVSSAVGIALSSCTTSNTSSSDTSNKFTYSIDWTDQDQLKQLTIDEQGLVYSSADKSEIITVAPNTAATSFVIPASVKYITGYNLITRNSSGAVATSTSYGAFENQTSLISITFASSDTLISIGDSSFKGCTYLSSITLPSSTTVVYNSAFENCTNLRNIGLANVSYVGSAAFKGAMANGADVSIDLSSATYIGDNAFNGSTSLANVDFSKNTTLTYIGISAFSGALVSGDSTTTIDLSKATLLKTISDKAFQNCTNLGSVVLSTTSALTTIGNYAFSGATSLTQVGSTVNNFTAPSSLGNYVLTTVTSGTNYVSSGIGTYAFANTKITAIDLSAVTTATTPFTNATFKNMTTLASVNFGSSSKITTIPYSLFENDTALTTLTLPASITSIASGNDTTTADGKSPFYNSGLQTIDMSAITSYATGTTTWNSVSIDNTTMLPVGLFQNLTSLTTVTLKTGTVVIGDNAFNGASSLTSVKENTTSTISDETSENGLVISSTMQMINANAFQGTAIAKVDFASTSGNSLWFIGQGAFQNATSLSTVDLSNADTATTHSIAPAAFYSDGDTTTSISITGFYGISSSTFSGATALTTVTLPSSLNTIYTEAFVDNTVLASINFDALTNLSNIGTTNFNNTLLTNIDLSNISSSDAISGLSSNFVDSSINIFNGLPTNAIVKLPAAMTLESGLSSTVFTILDSSGNTSTTHSSIEYPNGLNITVGSNISGYVSIGAGSSTTSTWNNKMLEYVSNDFNLASSTNGSNIQEYYPRTFFGNTNLKKLTLSASKLYSTSGDESSPVYSQQSALFIHNNSTKGFTSSSYNSSLLPFGNNSSLTNLVFSGFTLNNEPEWPSVDSVENTTNSLYRTNSITWAQVSTIINKFAANSINTPTAWSTVNSGSVNADSNINADSVVSGTQSTDSTSYQVTFTNSQNTDADDTSQWTQAVLSINNNIASNTTSSNSFIHNGVTWKLNVESGGAITLVGTGINVYKATRPNNQSNQNAYQICFNQGTETASTITVTLEIYSPTSNS